MCRKSHAARLLAVVILFGMCSEPLAADVVVSQVYGGGGNAGALLKLDFVELFNRGSVAVSVSGWSVQYASATATSWQSTSLSGTIQPGAYFLVQLGGGSGGTVDLPAADAVGTTNMSAAAGKVALVAASTALSVACPNDGSVRDFVGYGTANCFEGSSPAPAGTNTSALLRADGGCGDANDNAADFGTGTPNPRNQGSPLHLCSPAPSETPTSSPSATSTFSVTPSHFSSATPSPEETATPQSPSASPSETMREPTATESPTASPTSTFTETEAPPASATPTATAADTWTPTSTATETQAETATASATPTAASTETPSATSTATTTETQTPSVSPTPTSVSSETPTETASAVPTSTSTPQPTASTCGNAIVEPGEQCDDGNTVEGDLCPNGCSYRLSGALVHGHHRLRLVRGDGCQAEWYVVDAMLTRDAYGFATSTQTCTDQDPGCDFDIAEKQCRFMVVVCLNNTDPSLPSCEAQGVGRTEIVHPPRTRAGGLRAANRAALEHALSHLIDPDNPQAGAVNGLPLQADHTDFCSQPFAVSVDRRGAGAGVANLIVDSFSVDGRPRRRERARLRLLCAS